MGSLVDPNTKAAVAQKLAAYSGLPAAYVIAADLRIDGAEFWKRLQDASGLTTGRLNTRFFRPDMDPSSQKADYDPQSSPISGVHHPQLSSETSPSIECVCAVIGYSAYIQQIVMRCSPAST